MIRARSLHDITSDNSTDFAVNNRFTELDQICVEKQKALGDVPFEVNFVLSRLHRRVSSLSGIKNRVREYMPLSSALGILQVEYGDD